MSRNAGGLQQSVRRLHQSLNELPGVKVSVAALLDEYSWQDMNDWKPLPVSLSPVLGPPRFGFSPSFVQKVFDMNADIVQTHGIWQYPSVAVNRWHKKTRKPYLISPHGMLDSWAVRNSAWKKRIALTLYERKHLERASCIRALCESEAQAIRQFGLRNPICIIPNAIDLPPAENQAAGGMTQPPAISNYFASMKESGRKVLLYLGRIHPKKGLVNLVRAWSEVHQSNWILAIAGWDEGSHEAELKRLCAELRVPFANASSSISNASPSVSVHFLGPQFGPAKAACYVSCDAFILPSFSEGLPMVILEAWAYAKPVLMTPQCNLPEGFKADAAIEIEPNVKSITAGLDSLFRISAEQRQSLGKNGRALAAGRFNWPRCARELSEVYHWLLGSGAKPSVVI
jgi:glycosyltransferase involved in cell wall biosynthesis